MRILMIVAHPEIHGPLPKLNFLMHKGLEGLGVEVVDVPYGRRLPSQAKEESFLRKIIDRSKDLMGTIAKIRSVRPDLIFAAHTTQDNNSILRDLPMALTNRFFRIPLVFLYHGSRAQELDTNWKLRLITQVMIWLSNGIMLLSKEELPYFKKFWPNYPFFCVPYPAVISETDHMDISASLPPEWQRDKAATLIFIGRLVPPKGIQELIEAMPFILQRLKCHLVVLGDGELYESLQIRVRALGIEEFVYFGGYVEDQSQINAWYQASDIFVLPTYWREGFPVVILEAMASGLPVVCTKLRGVADYLEEGINALFIPPRDSQSLALTLIKLIEDEQSRQRMSLANRMLVQKFEPGKVMRQYLDYFVRILGNAHSPD
jgi:glycosyltransferase involved in cell wall biosynthesis